MTKRETTLKFRAQTTGAELMRAFDEERQNRARLAACSGHAFVRLTAKPPLWSCPNCRATASLDYVRGFVSALVTFGFDPGEQVADYGDWPC